MLANWRSSPFLASAALVGITAVWGYTFLIVQSAVEVMPVMDFMAGLFAVVIGGNQLTFRTLPGGACIVAAMLIVNLKSARSGAGGT